MKIALAQINPLMGCFKKNQQKILQWIMTAKNNKADLIVFPELALCAYTPLDLLFSTAFLKENQEAVRSIYQNLPDNITVLLGGISGPPVKNSVFLLKKNRSIKVFSKEILADFNVFDEKRYFKQGRLTENRFVIQKRNVQLLICEEIWQTKKAFSLIHQPPALNWIIGVNASPFDIGKQEKRIKQAKKWVEKFHCSFLYVNLCGGQEELIFDGASFALNSKGKVIHQSGGFKEELSYLNLNKINSQAKLLKKNKVDKQKKIQKALVFGIQEFVRKNGFKKAHLGLSGGVDSALTACLAVQALGHKNVQLLFLPGPFTSALSKKGALEMALRLKCVLQEQSISESYKELLKLSLLKKAVSLTKENLQARLRCVFLMAYANQHSDSLLLSASNKSELAVGYSTLYGDLSAGLLPIGDLLKTEVYALARYIKEPSIPDFILDRKPTAELKKNQWDEQDLAPYSVLDPVLKKIIEDKQIKNLPIQEKKIFRQVLHSEFKRKQSAPILKVKEYSFDRGWRIPLSMNPS